MHPSITSHFTKVKDVNIHYLSAGKGDVILLLHGWPTSSFLWRNIMPALAESHQVIAMDLPGFGQSDKKIEDSYSFRYYARIISGFLDNLGVEKITLGVHDLGGPLGLFWMVNNMEKVDKLILLNTLVYPDFSWGVKLFGLASIIPGVKNWLTSPTGIKKAIFFGVHQNKGLTNEVIEHYQAPFKDKIARKVLLKTVQRLSIKGFKSIEEKLANFKGAVQIVYGEKDRILPHVKQTMQRVKHDLPQANITILNDCGHFIQEEAASKISTILVQFMMED